MTSSGQEITQSPAKPTRVLGFWTRGPLTAALSEGEIFKRDYAFIMAPQHPYRNLHRHVFALRPLSNGWTEEGSRTIAWPHFPSPSMGGKKNGKRSRGARPVDGRQEHLSTIEMKERMRSVSGDKLSSQGRHNGPHSSLVMKGAGGRQYYA